MRALFQLGQIVATPGALTALAVADDPVIDYQQRHVTGDRRDLCVDDVAENRRSVQYDSRILSSYRLLTDARRWVITEADCSVTTLFLPEEY